MKSIESTTQRAFQQAMACASYRLPDREILTGESWLAITGLRYGLSACAAAHALLVNAQYDDEIWVLDQLTEVVDEVSDHFLAHALFKAPVGVDASSAWRVGQMAQLVADDYAPLVHRVPSIDLALRLSAESFCEARQKSIFSPLAFWHRGEAKRRFNMAVKVSLAFAERLYERRLMDIEEVPEIALLGE